jgi:hypothetical protein
MKHEIIYTKDYALIVSDEKVGEGSFIYETNIGEVSMVDKWYCEILEKGGKVEPFVKVIAHRPLTDAAILKDVPLLPEFAQEDDVEKIADVLKVGSTYRDYEHLVKRGIIIGYNKAKETYKYTEADIQKAFIAGEERIINKPNSSELDDFTNFIQSLQQPKRPIHFKCEMINSLNGWVSDDDNSWIDSQYPRKIRNSQGQTELVGKYIF